MPVKRSRVLRSSSQGELSVFDRPPSPKAFVEMPKAPAKHFRSSGTEAARSAPGPERAPNGILSLASPDRKSPSELKVDSRFGGFLEKCRFCKKSLSLKDNVYMYCSVYAFCTPECRDRQIAWDKNEKALGKSTKMDSDQHIWGFNLEGQPGAHSGSGATS